MRPRLTLAAAALLIPVITVLPSPSSIVNADSHIVAFDMVGSASQNLISHTNVFAGAFTSGGDGAEKFQRVSSSIPFSLLDDSLATSPGDTQGIVDDNNLEEFFGITDSVNPDNPSGDVTASWIFDVAGANDLGLSVDLGAMGDFEGSDTFEFTASIDGGTPTTVITIAVDESAAQTYTLAGGAAINLDDPLAVSGVNLTNQFATFEAPIGGSGSQLTITVNANTNGGSEAFAFQNLVITGDDGGGTPGVNPGDIVITEILQNPSAVFDSVGEWFEVVNTTGSSIDLAGWTIADLDFDSHVIGSSVIVGPGGTAVLGISEDTTVNGGAPVDYAYGSGWFLSNSADEVVLSEPGGLVIDQVIYDNGATFPDPNGASMSLDPAFTDAAANDNGANWCEATTPFGAGDNGTPGAVNVCAPPPPAEAAIHDVQGSGSSVAITTPVRVQAIVTSLFTRDDMLDGFFVQEEDSDADADPTTSEGIFVFCRGNCPAVATGDLVTIDGTPEDFFGMSQIDMDAATIDSAANPLPTATAIALPASGSTTAEATFESTEAMIVEFPNTLAVSEYFELARFGQVVLTDSARPYQFTDQNAPSVAGYAAFLDDLSTRRIILDDDNNDQNDATSDGPDEPYPYPTGGLSVTNKFRGGDTIDGLTGVLHWSWAGSGGTDAWRIRPIPGVDYSFDSVNPATASPDPVGGNLSVAAFNVLNLFSTLDEGPNLCGPGSNQGCRGANSAAELIRQRAKIAAAIAAIDSDIVGLIELENDDDRSVSELVDEINGLVGPGTYAYLPTGFIGEDVIKVGLIYQPAVVTPVRDFAILDESVDPRFLDSKNRPMLVQTFFENDTAAQLTVAVNHLKSKGSSCADVGDPGLGDGQANCAGTRTAAAAAIADFLAGDPTGAGDADMLVLGDLNSYAMEDPITALKNAGYTDLLDAFVGADAYTYLFSGQLGYLDYALANGALLSQVTGSTAWHINADEIPLFDYNDDIRDPGEASFHRESGVLPIYAPDALRASDHDPVVVGLDLDIDPAFAIATLVDLVDALEAEDAVNKGQANSLRRSLESALHQIDRGRSNGATGILTGVIEQLNDFVDDGILTSDEADPLISIATSLREQIS